MATEQSPKHQPDKKAQEPPTKQTLIALKPLKKAESTKPSPPVEEKAAEPPAPVESAKPVIKPVIKPVKKAPPVQPPIEQSTDSPTTAEPSEPDLQLEANSDAIFQAVGVIVGEVNFDEEGRSTVTISGKKYRLLYASRYKRAYAALKKEIETSGKHQQRLIVYPKVMHFPRKEQPYQLDFQLVGFDSGKFPAGIGKELQDFEFKLCGLWQFIPVCQTPCISVFKNFNQERLDYIKQADASMKVKFMKASHVPLIWKDSPIRPFRFNPKLDKEQQGHSSFVEIKAKFLPHRDVFGFTELLSKPTATPPKFLKAGKKDKAEALSAAKKQRA